MVRAAPSPSGAGAIAIADEAGLLESLRAGDNGAYERLIRATGGHMLAVARRFLGNEEDARDAVQEAYLSAFKALPRFQAGSKLSTWLHRITVNACLMRLRTRRRRPEQSIEPLMPTFHADGRRRGAAPAWEVSEERRDSEELRELVRAKINLLPDDYRVVLLLRDIEGMETGEAARVLGVSVAATKTRLHRARQALRTLLERELV